jgi:hypothetical protein
MLHAETAAKPCYRTYRRARRRRRLMSPRITATSATALCSEPAHQLLADIIQRWQYQIGLCDDADRPFPSRRFAEDAAAKEAHLPQWVQQ